jgi:hypothetical protein
MAEAMKVPTTEPRRLDASKFIVPPDWAVRAVSTNQGKRTRKYPSGWVQTGFHTYPGMGDFDDKPWGMQDGYSEHWHRMEREAEKRSNSSPVRGNLREEQYRFWNGSSIPTQNIATCRWCRHWAYGQQAMQDHQSKTDHTRILREIYDCARAFKSKPMCFVCGTHTRHERWGIPLCATNTCLNKWRVAAIVDVSTTLWMYAKYARQKGLLKDWLNEDGSEKNNLEANPKTFSWERASAY